MAINGGSDLRCFDRRKLMEGQKLIDDALKEGEAYLKDGIEKLTDVQKKGVEIPTESRARMTVAPGRLWMRVVLWGENDITFAGLGTEGVLELKKACELCLRRMEVDNPSVAAELASEEDARVGSLLRQCASEFVNFNPDQLLVDWAGADAGANDPAIQRAVMAAAYMMAVAETDCSPPQPSATPQPKVDP